MSESRIGDDTTADQPRDETGGAALGLNLEARLPPHMVVDTMAPPVDEELRLYRREAEVAAEAPRRAVLVHEAGHLLEHSFGDETGAVSAYSRALTEDAGLAPNLWALRRLAERGGSWEEVVKLLDAEVSFAAGLGPAERADLLVERGRILEDRLGRDDEAAASYRSALTSCPDHPAALLALLLLASRTSDAAGIEAALAGLTRRSLDAERRACWAVELARAQRTGGDPAGIERAFDTLQTALGAAEGAPAAIMRELARLIPQDGGGSGALRLRVLDELLRRPGDGAAGTAALLREKARLLSTSGRDPGGAVAALQRALEIAPAHPLLWRELAEAADRAGRPDIVAEMNERRVVEPGLHAALALRHAESLARSGRSHEALAILDGTPGLAQHDFQVWAARIRFLAVAGDAAGLASAFHLEAELAKRGEHARWTRAEPDSESRGRNAAEALVRSATLKELVLRDEAAAEVDYRAALAQAPHLRPAVDALERILTSGGRWNELAELLGGELDGRDGPGAAETDPARQERRAYLLETLVSVLRDRLNDPRGARQRQDQLDELQGRELRSRVRAVDLDFRLLAEAEPDASVGPSVDALVELQREAPGPVAQAALQLEAARSAARAGDLSTAEDLARQAATLDGAGLGAAAVEALQRDVDRRLEIVALELNAAEARGDAAVLRSLRFRTAFIEAAAGRLGAAVDTLAPLRAESDALALAWSDEMARRSGDPDVLISLLLESGSDAEPERLVALGEALEARGLGGDAATAASHFEEAMLSAASTDAALGLLRQRTSTGDVSGVVAALRCAAEASPPELAEALEHEGQRVVLASAPESHAGGAGEIRSGGDPEQDVAAWLAAARTRSTVELAHAHLAMAARLTDLPDGGSVRVAAMTRALGRARLAGTAAALAAFERVRSSSAEPDGVGWLLTDLQGELAATPELDELRRRRAERATGSLRAALLLDLAWSAERQGALAEAAATYGRLLADDPEDVSALEGLRRIAEAAGDRLGEARVLARLGAIATGPLQRTQLYHRAAMRFEECDHAEEAIALHWRTLAETPLHEQAFARLRELLTRGGDAVGLDRLLGFRLTHERAEQARVALHWERARVRLDGLHDRRLCAQDLHRILALVPYHTEAIRLLAQLCVDAGAHPRAAELLERYLQVEADNVLRNEARLLLSAVYQTLGDLDSAINSLGEAVEARPNDLQARERLAELYVNVGQWRSALDVLRGMERLAPEPRTAADIKLRIALILREQQDLRGAIELLRAAAQLDPLGDAPRELLALTEEAGDAAEHDAAAELAMGGVRKALRVDPLDAPALHQLRAVAKLAHQEDAAGVATQLLALIGETPPPPVPPARALQRPPAGSMAANLAHASAGGFLAEIWPQLCAAAWELDLASVDRDVFSRASRVAPGTERLAWLNAAAQAFDLGELTIHMGSVGENEVVAVDHPAPSLAVGTAVLRGDPAMRFRIGRMLLLLRQRAAILDLVTSEQLAQLVSAAGVVANAPASDGTASAELVRGLQRVLGRKEKKALLLETERFAMARDVVDWQSGVLRTADRAGLLVCGDLGTALRIATGVEGRLTRAALREKRRAMDLVDWALGPGYLTLRRDAGLVES